MLVAACDGDEEDPTSTATTEATSEATAEPTEAATMEPTQEATMEPTAEPMDDTVALGTTDLGDVLVDSDGMTLYRFANDEPGVSNCAGGCLSAWPPLLVEAGEEPVAGEGVTGTLGTIERDDGTTQVTINDLPLYHWASDAAPGDIGGQGVGNNWWVVASDGSTIES